MFDRSTVQVKDFRDVLDRVFGSDIQRLSEKFGVGTSQAQARTALEDVLAAREADLGQKEIDIIIERTFAQQSDAVSQFFTSVAKSGQKAFDFVDLQRAGLDQSLVALLDRMEALQASEEARRNLFRGKLTDEAFKRLDQARIDGDKETSLIQKVISQFATDDEVKVEQERLTQNQAVLNDLLSKRAQNTANQVSLLKQKNQEIEEQIAKIQGGEQQEETANNVGVDILDG